MRSLSVLLLSLLASGAVLAQAPAEIAPQVESDRVLSTSSDVIYYFDDLIRQQIRENTDALTRIDREYREALTALSEQHSELLQEINATQLDALAELRDQGVRGEEAARRQREINDQRAAAWAAALESREEESASLRDKHAADRLAQREVNDSLIARLQEERQRRLAMLIDGPIPTAAIRNALGGPDTSPPPDGGDQSQAAGGEQPDPMLPARPEDPRPEVEEVIPEDPIFLAQTITTDRLFVIGSDARTGRGTAIDEAHEFTPLAFDTEPLSVVGSDDLSARGQQIAEAGEFTPVVIDTQGLAVIGVEQQ